MSLFNCSSWSILKNFWQVLIRIRTWIKPLKIHNFGGARGNLFRFSFTSPDPDPDQFFFEIICLLSVSIREELSSKGEASGRPEWNVQHFKIWNVFHFFVFLLVVIPGSIDQLYPDPYHVSKLSRMSFYSWCFISLLMCETLVFISPHFLDAIGACSSTVVITFCRY